MLRNQRAALALSLAVAATPAASAKLATRPTPVAPNADPGPAGADGRGRSGGSERGRMIRLALLSSIAALAAGCGTVADRPSSLIPSRVAASPWPGPADYTTIKTALAVRDHALFRESDWRRKSFAAFLALRTLLTVRIAAGPCAAYVAELYGNLRDLLDAYPGEDWRPLVRFVHRQRPLARVCRPRDPTPSG